LQGRDDRFERFRRDPGEDPDGRATALGGEEGRLDDLFMLGDEAALERRRQVTTREPCGGGRREPVRVTDRLGSHRHLVPEDNRKRTVPDVIVREVGEGADGAVEGVEAYHREGLGEGGR
jgi:hypothetical protein